MASPQAVPELQSRIRQLKAMDWLDEEGDGLPAIHDSQLGESTEERMLGGSVPTTLAGRYELESLVAAGGFGQVWRAKDKALERLVAVKVTAVDCYAEARRVAQLKHHGIVSVHDVGNEDGLCYIVFDLVEGTTLAEQVEREPLTWQQSAQIIAAVADYVHHAHEKGFIHRDIKPANVLLDRNGKPVLADFGIAVTECELKSEAMTSVGTLAYMSPEQLILGSIIDARTDVYSLGVVLYELLTGRLPFADHTVSGLREKILTGGPMSPRLLNPAVPESLEIICMKCLSTDAADRYASAKEFSDELKKLLVSVA
ncbi:MAG TPA: serine/threonine-protein kinase [Pirellulales bacterium]|nr:serine/threonine-protein kinase [Pirellulales bacterium]